MAYYPSLEQILSQQGENEELIVLRRSLRSILSQVFYFVFSLLVVLLLHILYERYSWINSLIIFQYVSLRWLAIVPILFLVEIIREYHDDLYHIERHKITHEDGRLSLSLKIPSIKYIDIRAISVKQDIPGRIFNYGEIALGTASQDGYEMILSGMVAPYELAVFFDQLRSISHNEIISSPEQQQNYSLGIHND